MHKAFVGVLAACRRLHALLQYSGGPDGFCKPDIIYKFENLYGVTGFSLRYVPPTASPPELHH